MSLKELNSLRPFLSVFFIVLTFFSLVFLKMEERRLSYSILKQTREFKKELQKLKVKEIEVAKAFRPQQVERIARDRLTMKRISQAQIIRLSSTVAQTEKAQLITQ